MKRKLHKGFTLVELMVVIVIIGILAAVAIPKFMVAADKAKASEFPTVLTSIYSAQHTAQAELGQFQNATTIALFKSLLNVEIPQATTPLFGYTTTNHSATTFTAQATAGAWGNPSVNGQTATINQDGTKACPGADLAKLAPNWK